MPLTLTLEDQDRELLSRVLTDYLGDLRMEIRHTEDHDLRERKHRDEDIIKSMLDQLSAARSAGRSG